MPQKDHSVKEPSLYNLKHKESFVKQKGSSDVKVLYGTVETKKVLLRHREAPLFLKEHSTIFGNRLILYLPKS